MKIFASLSILIPLLLGGCAQSTLSCMGTPSFASLAMALCPQVAGVKSAVVGKGMNMPVEERRANASVQERNGRVVRREVGLQQTFWK